MRTKIAIRNEVRKQINRARKLFPGHDILSPTIVFTKRGATAGTCRVWGNALDSLQCKLNFNLPMAEANRKKFIARTPLHEVAHYINAVVNHNFKGHGEDWKHIMYVMGAEDADRCHRYKVVERKKFKRYTFHCDCTEFQLTAIRRNRILKGTAYFCKKCRQELRVGKL